MQTLGQVPNHEFNTNSFSIRNSGPDPMVLSRLEYKNLLYAYKSVCQQSLSNAENILRVRRVLWLTDSVATNALQQWKWLLKQ